MGLLKEFRTKPRHVVLPLLAISIIGYFSYHAIEGERGMRAYLTLQKQVTEARAIDSALQEKKRILDHRVTLLRPESLDRDMLEERARIMLGFGYPGDRIIVEKP